MIYSADDFLPLEIQRVGLVGMRTSYFILRLLMDLLSFEELGVRPTILRQLWESTAPRSELLFMRSDIICGIFFVRELRGICLNEGRNS